jgi:thiol-disulfide isomerase/thioredoxin
MDPILLRLLLVVGLVAVVGLAGRWWQRRDGHVRAPEEGELITADHLDDLGLDLRGAEAGAVLLGSPHCSPCEQVKRVLGQLAGDRPAFRWVAVDAALHLGLAESHRVMRVPTLFLVQPDGRILARTSGVPRVDDLRRVLDGEADLAHVRAA